MFFCLLSLSVLHSEYLIIILIYGALVWAGHSASCFTCLLFTALTATLQTEALFCASHTLEITGSRVQGSAAGWWRWGRGVPTSARLASTVRFPLSSSSIEGTPVILSFWCFLFIREAVPLLNHA